MAVPATDAVGWRAPWFINGAWLTGVDRSMFAARGLHVGMVHVNEPSSSRVDLAPFGGVKDSGLGREGPRYAMQEMTEERLITWSLENPQ